MSDEPRDDEILGRALARAIETQSVVETPYERARIATRRPSRLMPIWQTAAAFAALLIVVAVATWFSRPEQVPVAATPLPATVTASPAPTAPAQSAVPATSSAPKTQVDHGVVYFARDGLPPIGVHVPGLAKEATPEARIAARVNALNNGSSVGSRVAVPQGAFNPFPLQDPSLLHVTSVDIQGDTATVDVALPSGWHVAGSIQSMGLLKELVYTITEEPGIRYAVVRENGKTASIDAAIFWNRPLSREDVFGYTIVGPVGADHAISSGGPSLPTSGQSSYQAEGSIGTGVKLTFDLSGGAATPPAFVASMTEARDELAQMGKYVLTIVIGSSNAPTSWVVGQVQIDDNTPVRASFDGRAPGIFVRQLILDDARPWRAYTDGAKIVVELGGDPRQVSDRITVDRPMFDQKVGPTFTLSGAARVFEANVVWRLKDGAQRVIAAGHTTASLGTSDVWGTYQMTITIPSSVTVGRLMLEVYEASPKDGSEQGLLAIPVNR